MIAPLIVGRKTAARGAAADPARTDPDRALALRSSAGRLPRHPLARPPVRRSAPPTTMAQVCDLGLRPAACLVAVASADEHRLWPAAVPGAIGLTWHGFDRHLRRRPDAGLTGESSSNRSTSRRISAAPVRSAIPSASSTRPAVSAAGAPEGAASRCETNQLSRQEQRRAPSPAGGDGTWVAARPPRGRRRRGRSGRGRGRRSRRPWPRRPRCCRSTGSGAPRSLARRASPRISAVSARVTIAVIQSRLRRTPPKSSTATCPRMRAASSMRPSRAYAIDSAVR